MSDTTDTDTPDTESPATDTPVTDNSGTEEVAPAPDPVAATTSATEEVDDGERPTRKIREGRVVSTGMTKTAVVLVTDRVRHPRYNKTLQRSKKLHVHDETDDLQLGDIVRVMETRPLSKTKRWRLVEVIERAR